MSPSATALVIDDNPGTATALEVLFSLHNIRTLSAESPEEGLRVLEQQPVDLVLQDMNFTQKTTSGEEGAALFKEIRARHPGVPVILLTAWTHIESAVDLIKAGASDYVAKPWNNQRLVATVSNLLELGANRRELATLRLKAHCRRIQLEERFDLAGTVFADPAMERVVSLACQVARADVPVLITGPNGVGKERIAAIIQRNSSVADGPFVTLDCGALPSELVEAELFGAAPGAYTGAIHAREGKFEAADGGTLLLDEIGNLSLEAQKKLLRVLESQRFSRLGSNREQSVAVRILSATNADLPVLIARGTFREDLYYRLNVIEIAVPPLVDRPKDILPLATTFLPSNACLGDDAQRVLLTYHWPGNVRELRNTMQRAALMAEGDVIQPAHLSLELRTRTTNPSALEREAIEAALKRASGVVSRAAAELGLSRQALYRAMSRLGVERGSW